VLAAPESLLPLAQVCGQAKAGDPVAQCELGRRYDLGIGVCQSEAAALKWYRRSALAGLARAQYQLGRKYAAGEGTARDYGRAALWFRRSAVQGYALAQNRLGRLYQQGLGVARDPVEAHLWYTLAARDPRQIQALLNRDALARCLSSEDLAEARIASGKMELEISRVPESTQLPVVLRAAGDRAQKNQSESEAHQ